MNFEHPLVLLVAVSLVACAETTDSVPPAGPQPVPTTLPAIVPLEQYLSLAAEIECAEIFRCRPEGDRTGLRLVFGSFARCSANADKLAGAAARARSRQLVAAGSSRYDGAAARRCLESFRDELCRERPADVCAQVFVGTVPIGSACRRHDDCAEDGWCDTETSGSTPCPGVCARRVGLGQSCRSGTAQCSERGARGPVFCQYYNDSSDFRCTDTGVPSAPQMTFAQEGELCSDHREGANLEQRCAPSLDCIQRFSAQGAYGQCAGPQPLGQPCVRLCQGDAICAPDSTRVQTRCLAVSVRNREGESCIQGNTGAEFCNALLGLDCVAGRCQRVGTGELDSPCFAARFGVDNCRSGLACAVSTMTCRPRGAAGALCRSIGECESRLCFTDGTVPARCRDDLGCGL